METDRGEVAFLMEEEKFEGGSTRGREGGRHWVWGLGLWKHFCVNTHTHTPSIVHVPGPALGSEKQDVPAQEGRFPTGNSDTCDGCSKWDMKATHGGRRAGVTA